METRLLWCREASGCCQKQTFDFLFTCKNPLFTVTIVGKPGWQNWILRVPRNQRGTDSSLMQSDAIGTVP